MGFEPIRLAGLFTEGEHGSVVDSISEVFPSVLGICSGWARKGILQHLRKLLHFSMITCFADVDARSALLSCTVQTLHAELHFAAHQRVVSVTISALVAASYLDTGVVHTSGEDQVELMPVF